jgi:hypothetical protein
MFKSLVSAVIAFFAGVAITTLTKDKEILRLQKRIKYLHGYEYFSSIFRPAYDGGIREGMRRHSYGLFYHDPSQN